MAISYRYVAPLWVGLALLPLSGSAQDGEWMRTGRYSTVVLRPTFAQRDPLQATMTLQIPAALHTVGQALSYALLDSGYRLAPAYTDALSRRVLFQLPLPEVHRTLGPLSLKTILTTLAGSPYHLMINPVNRLVSFRLKPPYRYLASASKTGFIPTENVTDAAALKTPLANHNQCPRQHHLTVSLTARCNRFPKGVGCCPKTPTPPQTAETTLQPTRKVFQENRLHAGFNNK